MRFLIFLKDLLLSIIFILKGKKKSNSELLAKFPKLQKIKKEPNLLDKEIPQDGFGSFTFPTPNGTYTYTGIWKNGLKHGKGVEIDSAGNIINEGVWERGIYTYDKNGNEINYDEIQEFNTSKPKPDSLKETTKIHDIDEKVPTANFGATAQSLSDIIEEMSKLGPLNKEITQAQSWEDLKKAAKKVKVTREQAMVISHESFRREYGGPKAEDKKKDTVKSVENVEAGGFFQGDLKDGKRNGKGTMIWDAGHKYEGEYKDDKRNGQGTMTWADGNKYEGEWKDDKMNGQGTFTFITGNKYEGEWKDDKRNGQGTASSANGEIYVGEWKDDKRHGQGTFTSASGNKYEGEYKDNKMHGQGIMTSANGKIMRYLFENDKVIRSID